MAVIFLLTVFIATVSVAVQSCTNGDVRLVGGTVPSQGRVEVCLSQVWGTVTDDGFSTVDARVVCRQLGYPVDDPEAITQYKCCAYHGQGSGPIFLDGVGCRGTESSLLQCRYSSPTSSDNHGEDVGVICPTCGPDHALRLSNGLTPQEGIVEICFSGIWRSVCDSSWDHKDAFVVCREMGYPATAAIAFHNAYFGEHPRPNISSVLCFGNESTFLDCSYTNTSFCSPTNTAGVRCQGDRIPDPPCISNKIRLTGGEDEHEGRVEVCSNGVWGTICGSGGYWDSNDTAVVCRQLEYQNPRVFSYQSSSYFGQGNGPIVFDDLTCDGTELALTKCSSSSPNQVYCSHSSDVGIRCEEIETADIDTCTDGDVRLMDGETAAEGRVEICINSIWGSVCDDRWDVIDAGVVCNQLGFQSADAVAYFGAYFGRSVGPYNLDDVRCNGDESTLLECLQSGPGFHNCIPGKDAGVKCNLSSCQHGAIQLVGGAIPYGGRLEICTNGKWATVCSNNFASESASVVCKQLLGENASAVLFRGTGNFGLGTGRYILDDLFCTGLESSIIQCPPYSALTDFRTAGCDHRQDVEIICYVLAGCTNGDIRLVDGKNKHEGRVEMCVDGIWGAISAYSLTFQAARVICEQLGYPSEWTIPLTSSFFERGEAPVLVSDIYCSEDSRFLQDCYVNARLSYYHILYYYNSPVAGIVCQGNETSETECVPGDVKLAGGQTAREGQVEVCLDGFWATVCEEGWDDEDALIVCRQLGLPPAANPVLGFGDSERRGPVISYLACTSRESNISQCGWSFGTRNCHHGRDVGIRCEAPLEYQVELVINTPRDEGPFQIGTTITLRCIVDPPLPLSEEITYTWTTSASRFPPRSSNSSFPNATLTIPAGHPHESEYYCQVYRRQFLLGVGAASVQVHNLLYAIGNQVLPYTPTESVTLKVDVTSTDIRYNFRALTWFHNGMEVIRSERIIITDFNKTLTIFNSTEDDSGVYEVKFTGLLIRPYNKNCEQDILALLRHYPIGIPAHFHVYTNTPELGIQDATETAVEFAFEQKDLDINLKAFDNISLTIQGKVHTSIDDAVSTRWYFNGGALRPGTTIGTLKRPLLSISQTMEIENANYLDLGFYEAALTINTYSHLVSHLECPLQYNTFVTNEIGISDIVLARDRIQIVQAVIEPTDQEDTNTSNTSSIVGGAVGGIIAALLSVITVTIACILWQKRRSRKSAEDTAPIPTSKKSPEKPGNARYASATDNVVLGANISYEEVEYPGEIIYDKVN